MGYRSDVLIAKVHMAIGHIADTGTYTYFFADKTKAEAFIALAAQHHDDGVYHWEVQTVVLSDDPETTHKEHRDWVQE
jgi:hypothetical protein